MQFAEAIREARKKKGWSIYELANELSLKSPGYLSRIEARGEIPGPEMVIKLAECLGLDVKKLFELAKKAKGKEVQKQVQDKYEQAFVLYRKKKM